MPYATIYARQSFDRKNDELAITRQLKLCRELCAERGWDIAAEYVDNDRSATTGKVRQKFEELLASKPERIIVWHTDRLVRLTRDLERVIALGVNVYALKAGHLDLSNPAGRATARTITAWAQYEGEQKADRQRAANRQRAERGAARWVRRPFGFDRKGDQVIVVKREAKMLRAAAAAVRSGVTLAQITKGWNASDVPTTAGGEWSVTSVKRALLNPRLVGHVTYRGDDMGSLGPTILNDAGYDALEAKLTDPRRKTSPSTQVKYLLSGLVRCGTCDEPMYATSGVSRSTGKYKVYRCLVCKRVRRREYVDEFVVGSVLARLGMPDAATLLAPDVDLVALQTEVTTLRDRRDGLAALLADGLLSTDAVREQAQRLSAQITDLERQIDSAMGASPLRPLVGAADVAAVWDALDVLAQRAVVDTLMVAYIDAAGKGVRFSTDQVRLVWR